MKKIVCLLIIFSFCLSLCSCSTPKANSITTIDSIDDITKLDSVISLNPYELSEQAIKDKVKMFTIKYKSDDCEVVGFISLPADYKSKKYPVMIFNRGGNESYGSIGRDLLRLISHLSMGGYIIMASQYRGVDGGTGKEQFGGDDLHDVIKLIDIAQSFNFAASKDVYMCGVSRGGMMTYLACKEDKRIKAAAVLSGVSDVISGYENRGYDMKDVLNYLIGGSPQQLPEEYKKRSAIYWADQINTPLLIMHGKPDWRVDVSQAENMAQKLKENNKEYELIIYEGADHGLSKTNAFNEMHSWFKKHPVA